MIRETPSPRILSEACHAFSARFDLAAFEASRAQRELGISLPSSLLRAAPARQAEFVAGRFSARAALLAAGCAEPGDLGINEDHSPRWPSGFVGSITHLENYVSAAAASAERVRALGLDSERLLDDESALELQRKVLRPEELGRQGTSGLSPGTCTSLIFSAKESLYKALAPLVRRHFGFHDAQAIAISEREQLLLLRLEVDLGPAFKAGTELVARYVVTEVVHTAVELSATDE